MSTDDEGNGPSYYEQLRRTQETLCELDRADDEKRRSDRRRAEENRKLPPRALAIVRSNPDETQGITKLRGWLEAYRANAPQSAASADESYRRQVARRNIAVLSGAAGTGKTVAAVWWATQLRLVPVFLRASEFEAAGRYDREARDEWRDADVLILDDLGTEYLDTKGNFVAMLDELVDFHYSHHRLLVITTNCKPDEFRARYGTRIVDRLRESGEWMTITGASLRGKLGER